MNAYPMRLGDVPAELNAISSDVWAAAIEVHRHLGRFLLERPYRICIAEELRRMGHDARQEASLPVEYKGLVLQDPYHADIIVDDRVVVEIKCVDSVNDEHVAQLLNYMQLSRCQLGLLFNMRPRRLQEDFRRRALTFSR